MAVSTEILEQFRQRWGIDLNLPPALHSPEGQVLQVLPWQVDWLQRLEESLVCLPRRLIDVAGVGYLFVANDLRRERSPHDGVAYEFEDKSHSACIALSDPKWIGLDVSLLIHPRNEPYLRVPVLAARLLEEIAHVWDFRLEEVGSPDSSAGMEWHKVEFDERGRRKPFDIRNRRFYASIEEQNAEDWAAAVVWYVFQRDRLRQRAKEHYEFVERLFERCLPS